MEWTFGASLAFVVSLIFLSTFPHTAHGKCRGSYAYSHTCFGGNGKRSDPSLALTEAETRAQSLNHHRPSLLRKMLLSGMDTMSRKMMEKPWPKTDESLLSPEYPASYDEGSSPVTEDKEEDENTYPTRLELALAEVLELRKYTAALERLLRVRGSDVA